MFRKDGIFQCRICRAGGGTGVFGSCTGNDFLFDTVEAADLLCEFKPAGFAIASKVADAGDFRMFKQYAHMFCHCQTAGRITDLVGNPFQLIPGAVGKFKYGVEKSRTAIFLSVAAIAVVVVGGYKLLTEVFHVDLKGMAMDVLSKLPSNQVAQDAIIAGAFLLVLVIILAISYVFSYKIMMKKEY